MAKKDKPVEEEEPAPTPSGGAEFTNDELLELVELYGRDAVINALGSFVKEGKGFPFDKADDPIQFFLDGNGVLNEKTGKTIFGTQERPTFNELTETTALLEGNPKGPEGKTKRKEARTQALAALKPRIGIKQADATQQRSTQQQRAAQFGASQTNATTPSGLFDPAHLARRKLTDNAFFRPAGQP